MSSAEDLTLLLQRLRANNAHIPAVGNVSSVWWDAIFDKFGSEFYEDMVRYCDILIPGPDYGSLQPEGKAFTDACKRTIKNETCRTEEGVQDVLRKWTELQPKVVTYFELLKHDHSAYAHEQFEVTDSMLYYMAKFVERYSGNKNVWAPRVKRST